MPAPRLAHRALVVLSLVVLGSAAAAAQEPKQAEIVVDYGDGRVAVSRVTFQAPYTGLDLLLDSGLDLTLASNAVCAIGAVGCPGTDCFCACPSPALCVFWHYNHLTSDGAWEVAGNGPADTVLADGAVDGWVWSGGRGPITTTAASRAVLRGWRWLARQVQANGSLGDDPGLTADLVLAALAAGVPGAGLGAQAPAALDFLASRADAYSASSPAAAGKLAAVVSAAGARPRRFGGVDLVGRVEGAAGATPGRYGATVWDQAWSMLGLAAAGEAVAGAAADALAAQGAPGGGWGFSAEAPADPDSTGLALQAMAVAGADAAAPAVTAGIAYLRSVQNADGGWPHEAGAPSNVNSTAYALQGLVAIGEDPTAGAWAAGPGADTPVDFLVASQRVEGRFEYATSPADLVATVQALPALAGRVAGRRGPAVAADMALRWALDHRTGEGGFEGFQPGSTLDAVIGLAAVGADPTVPAPSGMSARELLGDAAEEFAGASAAAAGKLAVGIVALGDDPADFFGTDVVARLEGYFDASGAFGAGGTWDSAWALLGLAAAGRPIPAAAVTYLVAASAEGGGWGFDAAADAPDADSTGLALQALAAAGVAADHAAVRGGIDALRRLQADDGGAPGFGGETSAISTALAMAGLAAYEQVLEGPGWRRGTGLAQSGILDALLAMQSPAGGFAGFSGSDDPPSTYAALLALSGQPLPVAPPPRAIYLPLATRDL